MSDINLTRIFIQTDGEEHRQQARRARTISEAFASDGRLKSSALIPSLPWSVRDATIPGEVSTGPNQLAFPMPQGAIIRHVALSARVGPSGGPVVITLTGGDSSQSFSLPAGQTSNATGVTIPVSPGAWLRVNVTAANGAEDVTVSLHYSAGTGGF